MDWIDILLIIITLLVLRYTKQWWILPIILIHEMGHAIPAHLFSNKLLRIKSDNVSYSKVTVWPKIDDNILVGGFTFSDNFLSTRKRMIITLMGPLLTLIAGLLMFIMAFITSNFISEFSSISLIYYFYGLLGILSVEKDLKPNISIGSNYITGNDGMTLIAYWDLLKSDIPYDKAMNLCAQKRQAEAIDLLTGPIKNGNTNIILLRVTYRILKELKREEDAKKIERLLIIDQFEKDPNKFVDYLNEAPYGENELWEEIMSIYEEAKALEES